MKKYNAINTSVNIGDKFMRHISGRKYAECIVIDIITRVSTLSGEVCGVEYWAKYTGANYSMARSFEVAKTTIIRGRIEK